MTWALPLAFHLAHYTRRWPEWWFGFSFLFFFFFSFAIGSTGCWCYGPHNHKGSSQGFQPEVALPYLSPRSDDFPCVSSSFLASHLLSVHSAAIFPWISPDLQHIAYCFPKLFKFWDTVDEVPKSSTSQNKTRGFYCLVLTRIFNSIK